MLFSQFQDLTEALRDPAEFWITEDTVMPRSIYGATTINGTNYGFSLIETIDESRIYYLEAWQFINVKRGMWRIKPSDVYTFMPTMLKFLEAAYTFIKPRVDGVVVDLGKGKQSEQVFRFAELLIRKTYIKTFGVTKPVKTENNKNNFLLLTKKGIQPKALFKSAIYYKHFNFDAQDPKSEITSDMLDPLTTPYKPQKPTVSLKPHPKMFGAFDIAMPAEKEKMGDEIQAIHAVLQDKSAMKVYDSSKEAAGAVPKKYNANGDVQEDNDTKLDVMAYLNDPNIPMDVKRTVACSIFYMVFGKYYGTKFDSVSSMKQLIKTATYNRVVAALINPFAYALMDKTAIATTVGIAVKVDAHRYPDFWLDDVIPNPDLSKLAESILQSNALEEMYPNSERSGFLDFCLSFDLFANTDDSDNEARFAVVSAFSKTFYKAIQDGKHDNLLDIQEKAIEEVGEAFLEQMNQNDVFILALNNLLGDENKFVSGAMVYAKQQGNKSAEIAYFKRGLVKVHLEDDTVIPDVKPPKNVIVGVNDISLEGLLSDASNKKLGAGFIYSTLFMHYMLPSTADKAISMGDIVDAAFSYSTPQVLMNALGKAFSKVMLKLDASSIAYQVAKIENLEMQDERTPFGMFMKYRTSAGKDFTDRIEKVGAIPALFKKAVDISPKSGAGPVRYHGYYNAFGNAAVGKMDFIRFVALGISIAAMPNFLKHVVNGVNVQKLEEDVSYQETRIKGYLFEIANKDDILSEFINALFEGETHVTIAKIFREEVISRKDMSGQEVYHAMYEAFEPWDDHIASASGVSVTHVGSDIKKASNGGPKKYNVTSAKKIDLGFEIEVKDKYSPFAIDNDTVASAGDLGFQTINSYDEANAKVSHIYQKYPAAKKFGQEMSSVAPNIYSYTGSNYSYINGQLRNPLSAYLTSKGNSPFSLSPDSEPMRMLSEFEKHAIELEEPIWVYRNASVPNVSKYEVGDDIVDGAFLSTTISTQVSMGSGSTRLKIFVPAKSKIIPILSYGKNSGEFEMILPPFSVLHIVEKAIIERNYGKYSFTTIYAGPGYEDFMKNANDDAYKSKLTEKYAIRLKEAIDKTVQKPIIDRWQDPGFGDYDTSKLIMAKLNEKKKNR